MIDTPAPAEALSDPFGPEFTYNPEIEYVGDLLAIMHSDGGHHEGEHGRNRAAFDAIVKHYALRARAEVAEAEVKRLREALEAAIDHWEGKQEVNRRDGDRRASIIYGAVLHRAFDVLNGEEDAALAGSPS
ncbi:hypothetical protein [Deinococcus enclensis]|uniref:Plasmid stabilization system protein ParE n=1 Tax=Deinococcus enclensis TaxID=1049582 RepID=A0ABT9ME48_9DEIO|nr:hypothetical protein [Deinococcus enclensis]MDP9764893.1 plasmid stabilization system protein ParE [Deinococcus enclensis]